MGGRDDASSIGKYVINLEGSSARLGAFQARNRHVAGVVRFPAVDGRTLDRNALIAEGVMLEDCPYSHGTLGCALSHIAMWRLAIAEDRRITVIEDDMLLRGDFAAQHDRMMDAAPADWEYLLWGYPYENCNVWMDTPVGAAKVRFFEPRLFPDDAEFQSNTPDVALYRIINTYGAMAYSISPSGAQKFLDACLPLRERAINMRQPGVSYFDEGIDGPMNDAFSEMRAFVCFPPIAITSPPPAALSDRKDLDKA